MIPRTNRKPNAFKDNISAQHASESMHSLRLPSILVSYKALNVGRRETAVRSGQNALMYSR